MGKLSADGILVPECDKREYKALVLDNGLQVLLVSDPETDKAAAAMNVDVGYFSDPQDLPGLAHFLEHMLFFASEKYPEEDSYSKFLQEHGGHSNAFTSMEQTNYQLDVSWDNLDEALDRFAQFFISPLLSDDATGREVKAVHSEHVKNLTSDLWRFNQLQKSLSALDHPYHKFGTGSSETLSSGPASKGVDTRQELIKFYDSLYSADRMHLVVYGRDSVESLEEMVRKEGRFAQIKNKNLQPLRFQGDPFRQDSTKVLVRAVPVTEGHSLELTWSVAPDLPLHPASPSRYVSHLLGHEGHGSLFALLKNKGWATSLSAGESASSWHFAFFSVSIELTDEGHEHVEEVLEHTFQYIGLLRGPDGVSQRIFDEMRDLCATKFDFRDKQPPFSYARSLSCNMQLYPKEDWLAGASLPRVFNTEAVSSLIDTLSPSNVRVVWASKKFEGEAEGSQGPGKGWEAEEWYSTKFCITSLQDDLFKRLSSAFQGEASKLEASALHLPKPNPFIPTDFTLVSPTTGEDGSPELLSESPLLRVWHKADRVFGLPKACLFLHLCSPKAYSSPESALLTRLLVALLLDYLNEIAYDAEIAGLAYNIQPTVQGIQVTVHGYSHKLLVLANEILDRLAHFEVKEERFHVVKAKSLKDLENYKYDQPYQQALYTCSVLSENNKWHIQDYLQVLPSLSSHDLSAFAPHLLRRLFLEFFVAGNLTPEAATSFSAQVAEKLKTGPLVSSQPCLAAELPQRRFVCFKDGSSVHYRMDGLNPEDQNSALVLCLQVGLDGFVTGRVKDHVVGQLLAQVLQRDTFHELRTVQQLGYIVFLMARSEGGVHSLAFIIQSNVKSPDAVEDIVESFLEDSAKKVEELSQEEFKTHVESLISVKKEKKKNLREDASFVWKEIDDGTLAFNRVKAEVECLGSMTKEELISFFSTKVARDAPKRQRYSVRVVSSMWKEKAALGEPGKGTSEGQPAAEGSVEITDLNNFKRSMPLHPSVKGVPHPGAGK